MVVFLIYLNLYHLTISYIFYRCSAFEQSFINEEQCKQIREVAANNNAVARTSVGVLLKMYVEISMDVGLFRN